MVVENHLFNKRVIAQLILRSYYQDFFRKSSLKIFEATHESIVLDNVLVELPLSWNGCNLLLPPQSLPLRAINVIITNSPTKAIQHETCGLEGHLVKLNADFLTSPISDSTAGIPSYYLLYLPLYNHIGTEPLIKVGLFSIF